MVSILLTKDSFTLAAGGLSKTVNSDSSDFKKLIDFYRAGDEKSLENYLTEFKKKVEVPYKKFGFTVEEDAVLVNGKFLPKSLGERLRNHADQNLPVDRLLKFWEKLKKNPSHRSINALYDFTERNKLPLTEDGNVVAYKAIKNDFTDKRTGKLDNTPGKTVSKDRNTVDDDFRELCSVGLHVGGHSYVSKFGSGDDRFIEVSFSPEDVVSVPLGSYEDKIRVCSYTVLREIKKEDVVGYTKEHYDLPDLPDEDEENDWVEDEICYNCERVYCVCGPDEEDY